MANARRSADFGVGPALAIPASVRSLLLALLVVLAVGGAWAVIRHRPAPEAEPVTLTRPQEIRSVSLDGRNLPLATLRDVLTTRAGDLIDLRTVARDRDALEAALLERGYLAAQVAEPRVTFGAGGAAFVTFSITQGPQFRIRNVNVLGASAADAGVVTLGAGEIADSSRIALARQALEARLSSRGKQTSVRTNLKPDVTAGVVDVELSATLASPGTPPSI